jgi:hypothetical protein
LTETGSVAQYSSSSFPKWSVTGSHEEERKRKWKQVLLLESTSCQVSREFFLLPLSEASSTRRISWSSSLGAVLMMECTVLRRVDQASLWKTMTIDVDGRSSGKVFFLHLRYRKEDKRKRHHYIVICHSRFMWCRVWLKWRLTGPSWHQGVTC